jgi:hypothetical protein
MNKKGSAALVVVFLVVAVLVAGGIWYYYSNQSPQAPAGVQSSPAFATPTAYTTSSSSGSQTSYSLPSLPTETSVPPVANTFSYYHVSFGVPWKDAPKIITSADGAVTQLKFAGGQFITILATSPYTGIASSAIAEAQNNGDLSQFQSLYGRSNLTSDFSWMKLILSIDSNSANNPVVAKTLLPIRSVVLNSMIGTSTPLAVYGFSNPQNGFEVVGQESNGNTAISVANVLIYDSTGISHNLIIGGATQAEVNLVISSLKFD